MATDRRAAVLSVLRTAGGSLTITQIAERLAVHPNTVRFHLDALVAGGRVERVGSTRIKPGRPPLTFRAVPGMDPAGPRRYQVLAEMLAYEVAKAPHPVGRATTAGRTWGAQLVEPCGRRNEHQAVDQLLDVLTDLGFQPQRGVAGNELEIGLRNCPFLEIARSHRGVVCALHLGLMQGVMASSGAPITVDGLTPFAEPDLCVAHLARVGAEP